MEGNGEFDFWGFLETFWRTFWRFFEEFWRNWFVVRRLRTSIILRPTKKMRFWGQYGLQTALEVNSKNQIWNLWPKLHMLPCLFGLFWSFRSFYLQRSEQVKVWCIDPKKYFGAEDPVLYFTNGASFLGAKGRPTLCPRIFGGRGSIVVMTVLIFPCSSAPKYFFQQVPNGPNYGAEGQTAILCPQ